jgi:hypothetical protein
MRKEEFLEFCGKIVSKEPSNEINLEKILDEMYQTAKKNRKDISTQEIFDKEKGVVIDRNINPEDFSHKRHKLAVSCYEVTLFTNKDDETQAVDGIPFFAPGQKFYVISNEFPDLSDFIHPAYIKSIKYLGAGTFKKD